MISSLEVFSILKSRLNIASDYALAKQLGISQQAISKTRKNGHSFSDETAIKAAKLLNLSPWYFVASANAERTKSPEVRKEWEALAQEMEAREHKKIEALRRLAETAKAA